MAGTNLNLLNQYASQGGSYSDFLGRVASSGGLEAQEANALLKGGLGSFNGSVNNSIGNVLANQFGLTGAPSALNGNFSSTSGQVAGGYGPQGLQNLNNIYLQAFNNGKSASEPTGYGGGTLAPTQDLSQFDAAISQFNSSLGRLPKQLDIARSNIEKQFGINRNELDSAKNQSKNQFDTQTTQNSQNYRTNKNVIADQASQGLRGLQRMLGAYGAGGSSDARYLAPQAVADQASAQRAGAGQTFAQNAQGLDTNWNNFLMQDENSRKKLEGWRNQQLQDAESQSLTTKQDLLSKLAAIKGQRAAAAGGSYTGGAQSYLDQADALNGRIDSLARINPVYNGSTPVYQAPSLDSYSAGQGEAAQIDNGGQAGAQSYLALLLGNQRDKNKNVF